MNKDKTQILLENHQVYQETLNEFSSKSYELASVNEIIKRSQYNKGSFYYRFKDKFELYISLLDYVFVQQIDLYKKTGFSLITNDDGKLVLKSMFLNLEQLYKLDQRYYHLIQIFLNEKESFIHKSLHASVGSLYERYLSKFKKINAYTDAQMIVIKSVYKNFPIIEILNGQLDINDIIEAINGAENGQSNDKDEHQIDDEIEKSLLDPVNYLLIDNIKYQLSDKYFHLFDFIHNRKSMMRKIKLKTFCFKVNIINILRKNMKKPILNHVAIIQLIKNYEKIKEDRLLLDILYALTYALLDLKEFIVIDRIVHKLDDDQMHILMNHILPINGQLSKIIITERQLTYAIDYPFNTINYYDSISGIKKFHINDLRSMYGYKLYCEYVENGNHQKKYFDDIDELFNFKENHQVKILTINHLNKLSLNDFRGDVS